jgi:hypothetical protein
VRNRNNETLCALLPKKQTTNYSASRLISLIFLEARKGVRADFSVRPSGTAAKRRVPYPLIPELR